jgi:adenosyl cobinamide kinase/adenosyl cobinamide phosphate guanylyltransferase
MSLPPDIQAMALRLRGWNEHCVADELVKVVQAIYQPKSGWTFDSSKKCVEVLLLAAQKAYPTSKNIQELITRTIQALPLPEPSVIDVGREVAEQIEKDKEQLNG